MHFCRWVFPQMSFSRFFSWHFNFSFWSRKFILRHFNFEVELKKYFWRQFNYADFRSQPQNREIFMLRIFHALRQLIYLLFVATIKSKYHSVLFGTESFLFCHLYFAMFRRSCYSNRSLTWPAQGPGTDQARHGSVYNKRLGMVPRYTGYVPRKPYFFLKSLNF